jgi:hypothetical protein
MIDNEYDSPSRSICGNSASERQEASISEVDKESQLTDENSSRFVLESEVRC